MYNSAVIFKRSNTKYRYSSNSSPLNPFSWCRIIFLKHRQCQSSCGSSFSRQGETNAFTWQSGVVSYWEGWTLSQCCVACIPLLSRSAQNFTLRPRFRWPKFLLHPHTSGFCIYALKITDSQETITGRSTWRCSGQLALTWEHSVLRQTKYYRNHGVKEWKWVKHQTKVYPC